MCSQCGAPIKLNNDNKNEKVIINKQSNNASKIRNEPPLKKSEVKFIKILVCSCFAFFIILSIIQSNQPNNTSPTKNTPNSTNNISFSEQVERRFQDMGYKAKYKKNDDGSEVMLYINKTRNDYFGISKLTYPKKATYYFYGQLDDLTKAYVFDDENTPAYEDTSCIYLVESPSKDNYSCEIDDKQKRNDLQAKYNEWKSSFSIKYIGTSDITHHLSNQIKYVSNYIATTRKNLELDGYQTSIIGENTLLISAPENISLLITFSNSGIVDSISYTNTAKQIENEYIYSNNSDIKVNLDAQSSSMKDLKYTYIEDGYFDLLLYSNSYYYSNIEK